MRTVIIKGNIFRAMLAANRRCIVLHDIKRHPQFDQVVARVDNECLPELELWLCEPISENASEQAGALLFYSECRDYGKLPDFKTLDAHVIDVIHNETQRVTFAVTPRQEG